MKTTFRLLVGVFITFLLSSCSSYRDVAYFQDFEKIGQLAAFQDYEPKIKKDDMLNIVVSGPNKDVVAPYNNEKKSYIVDIEGFIDLPVLGEIQVEGLTLRELSDKLTADISRDIRNVTVNVSLANYKITILGEVRKPGTYTIESERTTILQALGMAGDLTFDAKRSNVMLIREIDGEYKYIKIDLRKSEILSSPYFYLCQNDVLYVTPTSTRAFTGSSQSSIIPIITSSLGLIISIVALIISL
ncbi:polysaccharide biosynthesis/export family protein [Dysgonomonas sp. 25]|uniref:polysaccharide biosynthesis/export family protein n=1 Tax=Dysgonomonas sp. 25 TaxID=2302933 RepID=UPI0013D65FD8|nr:polysaccharide biosynthesis/export family protein [Dysgonomonas sp. 25]NDV67943.1 polysaccharide export protein [Dysgonomonas sp. 25]